MQTLCCMINLLWANSNFYSRSVRTMGFFDFGSVITLFVHFEYSSISPEHLCSSSEAIFESPTGSELVARHSKNFFVGSSQPFITNGKNGGRETVLCERFGEPVDIPETREGLGDIHKREIDRGPCREVE